jgi:glycerophosphoryl diester phosphodiesterase
VTHTRIAHRGFAAVAEENSLAAIRGALALGCDMVEVDVRRRSDGALTLHHDSGDAPGAPLFSEALELIAEAGSSVMVDLKEGRTSADVADNLAKHARGISTVCSGNPDEVLLVKGKLPHVLAGRTWPDKNAQGVPVAERLFGLVHRRQLVSRLDGLLDGYDLLVAFHRCLSREAVWKCHATGRLVYAWTVDGNARVRWLQSIGVDGVISDQPNSLGLGLTAPASGNQPLGGGVSTP